ncbi:hypothetical protein, partial [Streptomyces sp. NPDC005568]|uniref:hypothetical protein n=1 Tax=Streptomyces sp. NPDC005568 TaxID=3156887 RepID=UPI00339FB0F8
TDSRPTSKPRAAYRRPRTRSGTCAPHGICTSATGQQAGLVQLMVEPKAAPVLSAALRERGWALRQ